MYDAPQNHPSFWRPTMRAAKLISVAIATLMLAGCSWVILWLWPGPQEGLKEPELLKTPKVVTGSDVFRRAIFYEESTEDLGVVTDLRLDWPYEPGKKALAVVGSRGVRFLDGNKKVQLRVNFDPRPHSSIELVRLKANGEYGYLNREQSWAADVMLFDARGKLLWTYKGSSGVDDSAAGDVDGDGKAEVVIGFNGDGGIHLVNLEGKKLWRQDGGNVWHVEMMEANGDGKCTILHSGGDWDAQMTLRDATGKILMKHRLTWPHVANFALTRWGNEAKADKIVIPDDEKIHIYRATGTKIATQDAPGLSRFANIHGTPLKISASSTYYASVLDYSIWDRAALIIHDETGRVVYQEVMADTCVAAAPLPGAKGETLLVGCAGKVWEYSLAPAPKKAVRP